MKAKAGSPFSEAFVLPLCLVAGTLLAWLPLLGRARPVIDDFTYLGMIRKGGFSGYFHALGFWRPLGQYFPIWVFSKNPWYPPLLALATHLGVVVLFFYLCRSLFGGVRLALAAALGVAMFPFGYEAIVWPAAYNYLVPVFFFLANLLLLVHRAKFDRFPILVFSLSVFLAFLTLLGNECLLFMTAFGGLFAWVEAVSSSSRRQRWLWMAPGAGCAVWLLLFYAFKGPEVQRHITSIHPATLIGVYYRQYSLADVFTPWFDPVTRGLLFAAWSGWLPVALAVCAVLFLIGLGRLSRAEVPVSGFRREGGMLLAAIAALLIGGSLIYVVGGGFSLDSRKKYPLLIPLLLLACWIYRAVVSRAVSPRRFFAVVAPLLTGGALTSWLIVGIWKYETRRYNALADFIVAQGVSGEVRIISRPDISRAWPQERRSLGYLFDDVSALNPAIIYRNKGSIQDAPAGAGVVIEYDPVQGRWSQAAAPAFEPK